METKLQHGPVIKQGWVEKQSRFMNEWRKRWLVLTPTGLATYKDSACAGKPTESIPIGKCQAVENIDAVIDRSCSVCVVTKEHNFFILAESPEEQAVWIDIISTSISRHACLLPRHATTNIKQGFLTKRSRFLKEWRIRQVVLTPETLGTYKSLPGKPTELLPLALAQLENCLPSEVEAPHAFKLVAKGKVFYFSAESSEEKSMWMAAIQLMQWYLLQPDSPN